jgi:hypothetical protein
MSLVNPKVPYITIRDAILNIFKNNKTALNVSLTKTFTADTQIKSGYPFIVPIPQSIYPVIFVFPTVNNEEWAGFGAAQNKTANITFEIWSINRISTGNAESVDEMIYLVSNIEALLRDNIDLSGTVIFSQLVRTEFGVGLQEQGVYVEAAKLELNCLYRVE